MLVHLPQQPLVLQDWLKSSFWSRSQGSRCHLWAEKLSQSRVEVHSTREAVRSSSWQAGEDAQCVELQKMLCWCLENLHVDSSWKEILVILIKKKKKLLREAEWHRQSANSF